MKKYILIIFALVAMSANALGIFNVSTAAELKEALSTNGYVEITLTADIDISSLSGTRFHTDSDNPFIGVIDGQGHTLSNYKLDQIDDNYRSLIVYCGKDIVDRAEIRNLTLKNFFVKGNNDVSFIACIANYTLFEDVRIEGGTFWCDDEWAGAFAAEGNDCVFHRCYFKMDGNFRADSYWGDAKVGGICGDAQDCLFFRCANLTSISAQNEYVGGIVGDLDDGSINNCIVVGDVKSGDDETGGIVGYLDDSSVRHCIYIGNVDSDDGGNCYIVGENDSDNYFSTNYFLRKSNSDESNGNYAATNSEALSSGSLAYLLNTIQDGNIWYEHIGKDTYPLPFALDSEYNVYSPVDGKYTNWNATIDDDIIEGVIDEDYLCLVDGKDLVINDDFYAGKVMYIRENPATWGTLCLPFEINYNNTDTNHRLYYFSDYDKEHASFIVKEYENGTVIPAGTPLIVKYIDPLFTDIIIIADNVEIKKDIRCLSGGYDADLIPHDWWMYGTYTNLTDQTGMFFISNNNFWKANNPITIPTYRAWFENKWISSNIRSFNLVVDEDGTLTNVGSISADELQGAESGIYNLQGQRLNSPVHGVNIINGKKTLVK